MDVATVECSWDLESFWERHGVVDLFENAVDNFATATNIWSGHGTSVTIPKFDQITRYYWVRVSAIGGKVSSPEPPTNGVAAAAMLVQTGDLEPGAIVETPLSHAPADGNIAYGATTQPAVESAGINGTLSYTSPAGVATRCTVSWTAQANINNTTSGVATGYARIRLLVRINGVDAYETDVRLEANLSASDSWGTLAGTRTFDVPAGQTIEAFLQVGRKFSTAGASPAQTIFWRQALLNLVATKR